MTMLTTKQENIMPQNILYAVSARVNVWPSTHEPSTDRWIGLPTFYLDANVQGIVNEPHAEMIVRKMLLDLGYSMHRVSVQIAKTVR
jgi:hypothetical protein